MLQNCKNYYEERILEISLVLSIRLRSESSPSGQAMIDEGYSRNADSPVSEDPDYAEESENGGDQHPNERGKCHWYL